MQGPFLDEMLPVQVNYGASFKHGHSVTIHSTPGGDEFRKLRHPFVQLDYEVSFKQRKDFVMEEVVNFFYRTNGPFRSFRVRDWADFTTNNFKDDPTSTDMIALCQYPAWVTLPGPMTQIWGGNLFQMVRWYGDQQDAYCARRLIRLPIEGTVKVHRTEEDDRGTFDVDLVEGVDFTVDYLSGEISTTEYHAVGSLKFGCVFDIPCRIDGNQHTSISGWDLYNMSGIRIMEVLNP